MAVKEEEDVEVKVEVVFSGLSRMKGICMRLCALKGRGFGSSRDRASRNWVGVK